MSGKLSDLIQDGVNGNGVPVATYSTLGKNKTRHVVLSDKLSNFLQGYCQLASEDEESEVSTGLDLGECTDGKLTMPVIAKFRFLFHAKTPEKNRLPMAQPTPTRGWSDRVEEKSDDDDEEDLKYKRYYDRSLILAIISCYQKAFASHLVINPNLSEYYAVVLESDPYRTNDGICVDLEIRFPYCQPGIDYYWKCIYPQILKELRIRRVSQYFKADPIGDWDTIIHNYGRVVPLYRSHADPNATRMKFVAIYREISEENIEDEDTVHSYDLERVFDPSHHSYIYQKKCNLDCRAAVFELEFWLPLFLSIEFLGCMTQQKVMDLRDMQSPSSPRPGNLIYDENTDFGVAVSLLPILSDERILLAHYRRDVGKALWHACDGADIGLEEWIKFCKRVAIPDWDEEDCENAYHNFVLSINTITVKTIGWYAREDNPGRYQEWHDNWTATTLSEALSKTHADVGKLIFRLFWIDYISTSANGKSWMYFHKTVLKPQDDASKIRRNIDEVIIPRYKRMRCEASRKSAENQNMSEPEKKECELFIEQSHNLIKALKNEGFVTTCIKSARKWFLVEDFNSLIDSDTNKMAWSNCVTEVCDKRIYRRPGKPEDYMTKCTGIPLREYDDNHPTMRKLVKWLHQLFPDRELFHYSMKNSASFMHGKNQFKQFQVHNGSGDNSKTMFIRLHQFAYGLYFVDFPVNMVTVKQIKSSSGPSPEMAQSKGAYGAVIMEPDEEVDLSGSAIKRFTGGDRYFTRFLNENGGSQEASFKLLYICNRIPNVPSLGKAALDRFVIIPYLSTWVENAPATEQEQFALRLFPKDPYFDTNVPEMAMCFAWLLFNYFQYYMAEGLGKNARPKIIQEVIEKHWEDSDTYRIFIKDMLTTAWKDEGAKIVDSEVHLSATDIYKVFKPWFRDYYGSEIPKFTAFKQEMTEGHRLGKQGAYNRWVGVKFLNSGAGAPVMGLPQNVLNI
jgi:hypothetical protein